MDGVHDMGGLHGFGPVVTPGSDQSFHERWEPRAQSLCLVSGTATRAALEQLDPARYVGSSYYERWLSAAEATVVRRGLIEAAELRRWRDALAADPDLLLPTAANPDVVGIIRDLGPHQHQPAEHPVFEVGDPVRVRRMRPERHHRCPRYLRGAAGRVERVLGDDPVPGLTGKWAKRECCYTVTFSSIDLFGDPPDGTPPHTLLIDLWERYLEPVT